MNHRKYADWSKEELITEIEKLTRIKKFNQDLYGIQGKHLVPKWLKDLLTYLKLKELQKPNKIKAKYPRRIVLNELNSEPES